MPVPYHPPSSLHDDLRAMHDWIHLERPLQRLRFTLDCITEDVLKEGLRYLRDLIGQAVARDLALHEVWERQVSPWDERQQGFAYAGWSWHPPTSHCIGKLDHDAVMTYLIMDVTVYDSIMDSIRRWEKEIKPRSNGRYFDYDEEVWRNEDGEEVGNAWP